jgi:hypothetical protein
LDVHSYSPVGFTPPARLKTCSPPAAANKTLVDRISFRFIKMNLTLDRSFRRLREHALAR